MGFLKTLKKVAVKAAKDAAVKQVRGSLQGAFNKKLNSLTKSRTPKASAKDLTGVTVSGKRASASKSGPQ